MDSPNEPCGKHFWAHQYPKTRVRVVLIIFVPGRISENSGIRIPSACLQVPACLPAMSRCSKSRILPTVWQFQLFQFSSQVQGMCTTKVHDKSDNLDRWVWYWWRITLWIVYKFKKICFTKNYVHCTAVLSNMWPGSRMQPECLFQIACQNLPKFCHLYKKYIVETKSLILIYFCVLNYYKAYVYKFIIE